MVIASSVEAIIMEIPVVMVAIILVPVPGAPGPPPGWIIAIIPG
jgi:hypothetical protein